MKNERCYFIDFDGVLFDSASEAFLVCQTLASSDDRLRNDVSYDEFIRFRAHVTDAWHFQYLYTEYDWSKLVDTWRYSEECANFENGFFRVRGDLLGSVDWVNCFHPYQFFFDLLEIVKENNICILSTRSENSIKFVLDSHGVLCDIYGQNFLKKLPLKKKSVAIKNIMSSRKIEESKSLFIDDMLIHYLDVKENTKSYALLANWGYDLYTDEGLSSTRALTEISEFQGSM